MPLIKKEYKRVHKTKPPIHPSPLNRYHTQHFFLVLKVREIWVSVWMSREKRNLLRIPLRNGQSLIKQLPKGTGKSSRLTMKAILKPCSIL
ncbi:hypothetical protein Pint_09734 [Pistacia integerrima]|uniref:Uncharacterized protein n=1 Tax=Pistacia integerrima TaxID=434235 RepID=A0ACC0XL16_9ROSI|nr:hypothetical protein Pint_09734 [Pistacia integerrima]